MWFWWFMLICDLLIPVLMIIFGRMMWKHAPRKINGIVGYRTKRSMQSTETWKYAHDYCGRLWWKIGWIMLPISAVAYLPVYHCSDNEIGTVGSILCTLQVVMLLIPVFLTERALKKKFT